jgi:hypothetical protein
MAKVYIPSEATPININNFYGINNTADTYQNTKLGEATICNNFRITQDMKLKKREGYSTYLASNDLTEEVKGMWSGVLNGEFTHIVRFGNRVFASQDITSDKYASLDTAPTNIDIVKLAPFTPATAGTVLVDNLCFVLDKDGTKLVEATYLDNISRIGKFYYHTDKSVWLMLAVGTYADIAAARIGLGTMRVYYYIGQV